MKPCNCPCSHCADGVWVVRNASYHLAKKDLPVFACKVQKNPPLSPRKQDHAVRETEGTLSSPVSLENAAPSSDQSQKCPVSAIPISIREDSPEIEYRPPALCLPVAKTHRKDGIPDTTKSLPFETDVSADKRHDGSVQGTVPPFTLRPPCAVDDHLSNAAPALFANITAANVEHREETKRKLRKFSRKRTVQLDFVEDDSDADPDWAPEKGFDLSRIDSANDSFSDDDSASIDQCPKRKRRNASSNRKSACADLSLGNLVEGGRIISPCKLPIVETVAPTTNIATTEPVTENFPIAAEGVEHLPVTVESVLTTSGPQLPRVERIKMSKSSYSKKWQSVQTGPVPSFLGNLMEKEPDAENRPADVQGVKKSSGTVKTLLKAIKSGLHRPRVQRVETKPVCSTDGSDWMPEITSDEDDSASDYACRGHKAGSRDSCRKPTCTFALPGNRKSRPCTSDKKHCKSTKTDAMKNPKIQPIPEPIVQEKVFLPGFEECPHCGKEFSNLALHVRRIHLPKPVLTARGTELGLEYLEETGSFGYACCGCYYPNRAVCELHQTVHGKNTVESSERKCPCCDFVAESLDDLVQHTSQHALDAQAEKMCFLCEWSGTDLFGHWRASHRELHDEIKKSHEFKCYWCRNRYRSREKLNDHVQKIHPSVESRQSSIEYMQKTGFISYYCPICVRYYPSRRLLDLHHVSHATSDAEREHQERQCPACAFVGIDLSSLLQHVMTHAVKPSGKKQCLFCSDQVVSLGEHYKRLHPEFHDLISKVWQFQCEQCEQKLRTKDSLKLHVRAVHGGCQCLYCALRFRASVKLYQHVCAEHKKDDGFPCPFCPKVYAEYRKMLIHYRKRDDIGQVVICDVCQHVFRNKILYRLHFMAKHSNEYRFVCKQCGKKYQNGMLLSQHVVRHHKWTEADRRKFNDRQKERRAAHKKKALEKDSDVVDE